MYYTVCGHLFAPSSTYYHNTHISFYWPLSPLWSAEWKGPSLNFNFISDLFFSIDLHMPCAAQTDIERGTDMEMDIDLE